MSEPLLTRYLQPLLAGRRAECFHLIHDAIAAGTPAEELLCGVIWPAMAQVDRLYRSDRINSAVESMATRINRTVANQLQTHLPRQPRCGRSLLISCAPHEGEELGAQIFADLFQSQGWEVFLLGGGVPHDEIVSLIGQIQPQALLIFGTRPQDAPHIRSLIDRIRDIGVCPTMNVVLSGGVFSRADGLWQEVGADAFVAGPREALRLLEELPPRRPGAPRRGIVKKRHRRRKPAAVTPASADTPVAAG